MVPGQQLVLLLLVLVLMLVLLPEAVPLPEADSLSLLLLLLAPLLLPPPHRRPIHLHNISYKKHIVMGTEAAFDKHNASSQMLFVLEN